MSTLLKLGSVVVGVGTLALSVVSGVALIRQADAASAPEVALADFGSMNLSDDPPQGQDKACEAHGALAEYREELQAAIAAGLGMTVEELQAAHEAGQHLPEIAEAQGIDREELAQIMLDAHTEVLALAVADGAITQEEADAILERMQDRMAKRAFMEEYRDELHAALADGLGMTVEEFEAALEAGQKPHEIAEAAGLDREEMRALWISAHEQVIAQAVADGAITQEQADEMLARLQDGPHGHGGPGGPGGEGRHGGPGGPGGGHPPCGEPPAEGENNS